MTLAPAIGEMYTVIPHRMFDGSKTGFQCGAWHCRVKGNVFDGDKVTVQEMKIVDGRWKPAMSTCIRVDKLGPLEVDVDLFGDPVGGAR